MRLVFLGSGLMGLPALRWLQESSGYPLVGVVTQPDRPAGRGLQLIPGPIKAYAASVGLPILQPEKLREPAAVQTLANWAADLHIVVAFGQILSREVLALPRIGTINLHASLLPRHRGASPIQAAILAGDAESGLTVMHVVPELDAGDIILQKRLRLAEDETGGSLHDRLADLGPAALAEALPLLAAGQAPRIPQDASQVTYAGKLSKEAGKLDWRLPCHQLERQVRAYHPWPGAYAILPPSDAHQRLKITRALARPEINSDRPGTVLTTATQKLLLACGEGALEILEAQLPGRKNLPVADLLRGWTPAPLWP